MSLPISSIVDVNISRITSAASQAAFGIPLLVSEHTNFSDRTTEISQASDLLDLGFLETDVIYAKAVTLFSQELKVEKAIVGRKDELETWTEALNAIENENPAWYALLADTSDNSDILAVAAWTEQATNDKLYSYQTSDSSCLDANVNTDILSQVSALNYDRSFGSFTDNGHLDAGILGEMLPYPPGTRTAKFKKIKNVVVTNLSQ